MGLIPCKCEDLKNEYVKLDKLLHTFANFYALSRKETDRSLYFTKLEEFHEFVDNAQKTIVNCNLHLTRSRLFLSRCTSSIDTIYRTDCELNDEATKKENEQIEGH